MQLVIVRVALQVIDGLLPVGGEDVLVLAVKALVNLLAERLLARCCATQLLADERTFAHGPVYSSAGA